MKNFLKKVICFKREANVSAVSHQQYPYLGYEAVNMLLKKYNFETVLDIGCGEGKQCDVFLEHHKKVTCIDYGYSTYFSKNKHRVDIIIDDFMQHRFREQFDCVWCCHVLV